MIPDHNKRKTKKKTKSKKNGKSGHSRESSPPTKRSKRNLSCKSVKHSYVDSSSDDDDDSINNDLYPSSDETSSDSDSDNELPLPPLPVYGACLGTAITKKLRKKIKKRKFVEMSSLLTSRSLYSADEYVVKSDKNNKTRFYKRPDKIDISFSQWEEAFDTSATSCMAIFCQCLSKNLAFFTRFCVLVC